MRLRVDGWQGIDIDVYVEGVGNGHDVDARCNHVHAWRVVAVDRAP
jgi:hypothetical protein